MRRSKRFYLWHPHNPDHMRNREVQRAKTLFIRNPGNLVSGQMYTQNGQCLPRIALLLFHEANHTIRIVWHVSRHRLPTRIKFMFFWLQALPSTSMWSHSGAQLGTCMSYFGFPALWSSPWSHISCHPFQKVVRRSNLFRIIQTRAHTFEVDTFASCTMETMLWLYAYGLLKVLT